MQMLNDNSEPVWGVSADSESATGNKNSWGALPPHLHVRFEESLPSSSSIFTRVRASAERGKVSARLSALLLGTVRGALQDSLAVSTFLTPVPASPSSPFCFTSPCFWRRISNPLPITHPACQIELLLSDQGSMEFVSKTMQFRT